MCASSHHFDGGKKADSTISCYLYHLIPCSINLYRQRLLLFCPSCHEKKQNHGPPGQFSYRRTHASGNRPYPCYDGHLNRRQRGVYSVPVNCPVLLVRRAARKLRPRHKYQSIRSCTRDISNQPETRTFPAILLFPKFSLEHEGTKQNGPPTIKR